MTAAPLATKPQTVRAEIGQTIQACRRAGLPVVNPQDCTCGLRGRLVVLTLADGLKVVWPYQQRCPTHGHRNIGRSRPALQAADGRSRPRAAAQLRTRQEAGVR